MGYSYDMKTNQLCCDICGGHGQVRKRPCPAGHCPSIAMCPACYADKAKREKYLSKKSHFSCYESHKKWEARNAAMAALLASGKAVRCAAMQNHNGRVQVLFSYQDGSTVGWFMDHATYDAIPLLDAVTVEDYGAVAYAQGHLALEVAPADFTSEWAHDVQLQEEKSHDLPK